MKTARTVGEIVAALMVVVTFAVAVHAYIVLPPTIATEFWGAQADGHGSKATLLILPIVSLIAYAGI